MSGWVPILEGADAEAAWTAIRAVARAVADGAGERHQRADLLLFWSYLAGALDEDWIVAAHERAFADVIDELPHVPGRGLIGGLAGTAWVLAHVAEPETVDELLAPIDASFERELAADAWDGSYDLIGGLVGRGIYLLERHRTSGAPPARRALARVLDHLLALGEPTADGMAWFTPPRLVPKGHHEAWPDGYFNYGLAHGNPGVVALLGRLAELPEPRAAAACLEATRWLLAQRLPPHPRGRYPLVVARGERPLERTRAAWCYGDPGVAVALWGAAARCGRSSELADAQALGRECAARAFVDSGVVDPGLCHGAAGLAHIFNRMYQASGDEVFRTAATTWLARTLAMRREGGLGGFAAWTAPRRGDRPAWVPVADVLDGALGVALALLAAVHSIEPGWDRLLLCDVR